MSPAEPQSGPSTTIAVLGAGSWGTALALQMARCGHDVVLWGRDRVRAQEMARTRENRRYLPGATFPESLSVEPSLEAAVQSADRVLLVTPSHGFPEILAEIKPLLSGHQDLAWASKGFEPGSGRLLHQVLAEVLGDEAPMAVVTGPSFAREVADNLPTAVTVASPDLAHAQRWVDVLHGGSFRAYVTDDIVGAELGGAVKNVLAVGTGIIDGMQLGTNARAAMMTRGLAEMMRLSEAMGARRETLMGLSGIGDLILTCTGDLSRNRRFGLAIGRGTSQADALAEIDQVVEGVRTAEELMRLSRRYDIELPISEQISRILDGSITPTEGVRNLMSRDPKPEA